MKHVPPYMDPEKIVPIARSSTEVFKTGTWSSRRPVHIQKLSPCWTACPAGNSIPRALLEASRNDMDGALRVFLEENPLPGVCGSVCYHPCEASCNRGSWDGAVNVRAVERAAARFGTARPELLTLEGEDDAVAIVGSGPAGLSAAYHLARMGHPVTIYEAERELGGLLRSAIPEFRLHQETLRRDLDRILSLNVRVETGIRIDAQRLEEIGAACKAVFLAVGVPLSRSLGIPGSDSQRVLSGLDFLKGVRSRRWEQLSGTAVIVGGGNVAVDAALSAVRLGASEVAVVCLEQREQMVASAEEYELALQEGVLFHHGWAPQRFLDKHSGIEVEFSKCEAIFDEDGSFNPRCDHSVSMKLNADWIIQAIGQEADLRFLEQSRFTGAVAAGSLRADPVTMETAIEGVYAGGDVVNMPGSVVQAIAAGKRAAVVIHLRLCGKGLSALENRAALAGGPGFSIQATFSGRKGWDSKSVVKFEDLEPLFLDQRPRVDLPVADPELRKHSFQEIIPPLDLHSAFTEASRCFFCGTCSGCDRCFLFCPEVCGTAPSDGQEGYRADPDYCKGCSVCAAVCPRGIISMDDGV